MIALDHAKPLKPYSTSRVVYVLNLHNWLHKIAQYFPALIVITAYTALAGHQACVKRYKNSQGIRGEDLKDARYEKHLGTTK